MSLPQFWLRPPNRPGLVSNLLSPCAALWAAATQKRLETGPWHRLPVPVICVGNLFVGGTGKTPTVIALIDKLHDMGLRPHVISRGHGGKLHGPEKVDPRRHKAADVGDEPLLLAEFCDAWVGRDRLAASEAAIDQGCDLVVLDDGFQNPRLQKDLSIVVVDSAVGFGNGRVIPSGPLREPIDAGLARADMLLSVGSPKSQIEFQTQWKSRIPCKHLWGELKPLTTGMDLRGQRVMAFAGIGRPAKFFETLRELGADVVRTEALEDHQPLPDLLLHRLEAEAASLSAQLVTTEKDATRLPPEFRTRILTVPARLHIADWTEIDAHFGRIGLVTRTP